MGIDWEEILDAEGEELEAAYEENLYEEEAYEENLYED